MSNLITVAVVAAAVGSALIAGLMLAFSTSVMPALGRRPAAEAVAAMQTMNATILNPLFGLVFGGTFVLAVVLVVTAPFTGDEAGAGWRAAGGLLYAVGVTGVTMAVNVPMNNALDAVDAASQEAADAWPGYLRRWTAWNHLRTVAGTAASVLLVVAVV
jgi:uncharacterized membrane protein